MLFLRLLYPGGRRQLELDRLTANIILYRSRDGLKRSDVSRFDLTLDRPADKGGGVVAQTVQHTILPEQLIRGGQVLFLRLLRCGVVGDRIWLVACLRPFFSVLAAIKFYISVLCLVRECGFRAVILWLLILVDDHACGAAIGQHQCCVAQLVIHIV